MQTDEQCKSYSGVICTRDKVRQKLFTSQGKQRRKRAEVSKVLQEFMLPLRPATFRELEAAPPRFHLFSKHANDSLMIRAGECAMCRMRPGVDSRGRLNPPCTALHIHGSLCPLAGSARGCCPVLFSRGGEGSSLSWHLGCGSERWRPPALRAHRAPPAAGPPALQSTAPGSLCSSSGEF